MIRWSAPWHTWHTLLLTMRSKELSTSASSLLLLLLLPLLLETFAKLAAMVLSCNPRAANLRSTSVE